MTSKYMVISALKGVFYSKVWSDHDSKPEMNEQDKSTRLVIRIPKINSKTLCSGWSHMGYF